MYATAYRWTIFWMVGMKKTEGLWVNRYARIVAFVSGIFGFVGSTSCELQNVEGFYVYMSEVKVTIFIEINSLR